jgi:hypothetical protein
MLPPSETLATSEVCGLVRIRPPESTAAVTLLTAIERMSIVPPLSTATAIAG